MSDRLEAALRTHKPAFIAYLMAGDPDVETTELLARALAAQGVAALELGIPYGDPLADGPTIAAAGQRALGNGVGVRDVLALTKRIAASVPVVLFTYFNPVYRYGVEAFARDAAAAGASGVIIPDVSVEELGAVQPAFARCDLAMPLLVAPTTPPQRAAEIVRRATGFVYVVSRLGVTGTAEAPYVEPLRAHVVSLRAVTEKPLAVGFGISAAEHVRAVAPFVDGVIVGSALIDAYAETRGDEAVARVTGVVRALLAAFPA